MEMGTRCGKVVVAGPSEMLCGIRRGGLGGRVANAMMLAAERETRESREWSRKKLPPMVTTWREAGTKVA